MVFGNIARLDKPCPLGERVAHALVCPGNLTGGQGHVELVTIGAQVHIVENAGPRPQRRSAGGQTVDASFLEQRAIGDEFIPVCRHFSTNLCIDILVVIDAPLVIGIGHAPLLVIDGHRGTGRGQAFIQASTFPNIRYIHELARIYKRRHAVAGIPVGKVG